MFFYLINFNGVTTWVFTALINHYPQTTLALHSKGCFTRRLEIYEQTTLYFLIKQPEQITQKQDKRNLYFFNTTFFLRTFRTTFPFLLTPLSIYTKPKVVFGLLLTDMTNPNF